MSLRAWWIYLLCTLAFCVANGSPAQGLVRAEQPNVKVGESWVYQAQEKLTGQKRNPYRQTVAEVDGSSIKLRSGKLSISYTREFNAVETRTEESVTYRSDPAWGYYQFPLEVGKTYNTQFESTNFATGRKTKWQWKAEVVGSESVTTPAGTFDTLKIKYSGTYNGENIQSGGRWTGSRTETLWYAPAVNRHVKLEWQELSSSGDYRYNNAEVVELMSYRPGKQESSAP